MIFATLYLIAAILAAFFTLAVVMEVISKHGSVTELILLAIPIGVLGAGWTSLFFTTFLPMAGFSAIALPTLCFASIAAIMQDKLRKKRVFFDWQREKREWWPLWVVLGAAALFIVPLFKHHYLSEDNGRPHTGGSTYGDLAFHLQIITSITDGPNGYLPFWKWRSPLWSGSNLVYPFIFDFVSAVLVKGGFSLAQSLWIPSSLMALAFVGLMHALAARFASDHRAGFFAVMLTLNPGGWGFLKFWKEHSESGLSLLASLSRLQADYVHDYGQGWRNGFWFQMIGNVMIPQRTSLAGFPLIIGALLLIYRGVVVSGRRPLFIVAGVLAGLAPMCLAHAYIGLAIFCAMFALFTIHLLNDWLWMALVAGLLGAPQMLWFMGRASQWGVIKFMPVWVLEPPAFPPFLVESTWIPIAVKFWPAVLGIFPLMSLLAIPFLNGRQIRYNVGFMLIWVIGSLFQFQPWILDNIKLIYVWYFGASIAISAILVKLWNKGLHGFVLAMCLLLVMTSSGMLGNIRENSHHNQYFDTFDMEMANWIKENTDPEDLFLASQAHNHPVPCLTGRGVLMGYAGWLWTHGYNAAERQADYEQMWHGVESSLSIMHKHSITYVVIGPTEKHMVPGGPNIQYFENEFKKVYSNAQYSIYEVK